jgi:DNA-binding CsgD family transcriptional regulator
MVNELLSRREQRILEWLSEGLRDKDIGPLLGLTTRSVTRIVCEICDKLDARTRTQAVCMFLIQLIPYPLPPAGAGLQTRPTSGSTCQIDPAAARCGALRP